MVRKLRDEVSVPCPPTAADADAPFTSNSFTESKLATLEILHQIVDVETM